MVWSEAMDLTVLAAVAAEGSREWSSAWPEASVSRSLDKGNADSENEIQTCQTVKQRSAGIHPCHTAAVLSGRPKELCFTTLSLAMETMGMRLSVVKQSFFGPPGQYGRLVTRANIPTKL